MRVRAGRALKARALRIEIAGKRPAMTLVWERNAARIAAPARVW
jgi:hypothetical protein